MVLIDLFVKVFQTEQVWENIVTELVHKSDLISLTDNDTLLEAVEHLLVHIPLLIWNFCLANLFLYDSVVYLKKFGDHDDQEHHCNYNIFDGMTGHIFGFEIGEKYHSQL